MLLSMIDFLSFPWAREGFAQPSQSRASPRLPCCRLDTVLSKKEFAPIAALGAGSGF
jgi:hypothetical protein